MVVVDLTVVVDGCNCVWLLFVYFLVVVVVGGGIDVIVDTVYLIQLIFSKLWNASVNNYK